jgi:hypothetical protein
VGSLTVTVNGGASATDNLVTVSNISVSAAGVVTADIVANCLAAPGNFTLTVTDGGGLSTTANLTVLVSANTAPVMSYATQNVVAGTTPSFGPATGPSDNGTFTIGPVGVSPNNGGLVVSLNQTNGQITVVSALLTGQYTVTVPITDNCGATTNATVTVNVTCPTITLNQGSLVDGTVNTAYGATISASPAGGNYTFAVTNGTLPAGLTLNTNGSFSGAPTASGSYNFRVTATGFGGCTGFRDYTLEVNRANSIATITSDSPDPSVFGENVTVNYTVVGSQGGGAVPTGNVVVTLSGWTDTCTGTVSSGTCVIPLSKVGTGTLVLNYAGDINFNPSSDTEAHAVDRAGTATVIVSDLPDPSVVGQNYTVTFAVAAVAPGAGVPTGNVTVSDGTNTCVAILPATSCVLSSTTAGAKTLTATYSGDGNFNGSVSATAGHQVNPAATNTGVQTVINAPNYGSTLTATATITAVAPGAGIPQGTVNFNDGGNAIAGCQNVPVSALGAAVCTTNQLPAGTNKVIQAVYSGNANYLTSNGSTTQTIGKAPLNVTASSHTVTYGDAAPAVTVQSITGFVLGETAANLSTQPTCSTTYTQGASVSGSQYPTSCAGGVSNNYSFNYIGGTVTVNKKALTVTADPKSRAYGAANPALTATLTGFVGSDNAGNSTTGTAGLTTTATTASPVGSYPIN